MIPKTAANAEDLVKASSPLAIESQLRLVATRMRRWKRWLNSKHRYNGDVVEALKPSIQQGDVDGPKLGEYIAASAPLHLTDGWNYLSRAFDAASRGDRGSAYHLAYYAELRAAMSILATEGIGIFNNRHIALNANLEPTEYKGGTHVVTWEALSAWSRESGRAERLLEAITIEYKSLSEWLQEVGVVDPNRLIVAEEWLREWSVDLKIFASDSGRRNQVSYRPTRIRVPAPQSVDPRLELERPIFDSWAELRPDIGGTCVSLDLSLLRRALELVVDKGICSYASFDKALGSLEQRMSTPIFQALSTESESATVIFQQAKIGDSQGTASTPILARALLMLRLATASTASLLVAARVTKSDLEFWWAPLGSDSGLWDTAADIETFSDLWSDVDDAMDEAREEISDIQGTGSVQSVARILAQHMSLTQFSRAPMWLLDLD